MNIAHINRNHFQTLNIVLGSPILIQKNDQSTIYYLCSAFPHQNVFNSKINFSKTIQIDKQTISQYFQIKTFSIEELSPIKLSTFEREKLVANFVGIEVIEKTGNLNSNLKPTHYQISKYLQRILIGIIIFKNSIIKIPKNQILNQSKEKEKEKEFLELKILKTKPINSLVLIRKSTELSINFSSKNKTENNQNENENENNQINIIDNQILNSISYFVGGMQKVINSLSHLFNNINQNPSQKSPQNILLIGPDGIGKRSVIESFANHLNISLFKIDGKKLNFKYFGEREDKIREIFHQAYTTDSLAIIFLQNMELLCPKRSEVNSSKTRLSGQFLALLDGKYQNLTSKKFPPLVVATCRDPNMIDPALRRPGRLTKEIHLPLPDENDRLEILKIHTRKINLGQNTNLQNIAMETVGYLGSDLYHLCREATMNAIRREIFRKKNNQIENQNSEQQQAFSAVVEKEDFENALTKITPTIKKKEEKQEIQEIQWDEIGGLEDIKKKLLQAVEWPIKYRKSYERLGLERIRGILLYGPPGCSKTTLAKAVATSAKVNFISLSGASIYSIFLGDAEQRIRDLFRAAREASPSIIFLDEIESLVGKRSTSIHSHSNSVRDRVLSTLLNEMDGIESAKDVLVLAATNRVDLIDEALLRPGRFDQILKIDLPNLYARQKIFEIKTRNMNLDPDVDLKKLSQLTHNMSGADIENIVRETAIIALRENVEQKILHFYHFQKALKEYFTNKNNI
ncbi:cell division control protein 48 [Anaeramoeba ignava]|uniref:Cell division control protein 48 n=1 Tax=Anaeramoeba ignava TaxID=1746090 RepID=A0A9Q0L9S8_ANAIG|nr:cell division control protein 48 [Anaeramoeba ignava]